MGLDSVELVLKVEDTLRIRLRDEDAEKIRAVGELFDCIMSHLEGHEQGCLSSFAFYRLRRTLMSVRGLARNDIRLSSEVAKFFPEQQRRAAWSDLQAALGLRLPELGASGRCNEYRDGDRLRHHRRDISIHSCGHGIHGSGGRGVFCRALGGLPHSQPGNRAVRRRAAARVCDGARPDKLSSASKLPGRIRPGSTRPRRRSLGDASHHYCGPTWRAAG